MPSAKTKKEASALNTVRNVLEHSVVLALAAAATLVGTLAPALNYFKEETFSQVLRNASRFLPVIALGFAFILVLVTMFVFLLQLNVRKTSSLRYKVAAAFVKALNDSAFNPRRVKKDNPHEHKLDPQAIG